MNAKTRFSFIYAGLILAGGAIIIYMSVASRIHINELTKLSPNTGFIVRSTSPYLYLPQGTQGKLSDYYYCLRSYRPLSWRSANSDGPGGVELLLDNGYFLDMGTTGGITYSLHFSKRDDSDEAGWKADGFALNCDLSMLNKTLPDNAITQMRNLSDSSVYNKLYISNPDLSLPKSVGKLGKFRSCLDNFQPWSTTEPLAEIGMIKLDMSGYLLHLGATEGRVTNFQIEQYDKHRRTEAISKVYLVDCPLSLLST